MVLLPLCGQKGLFEEDPHLTQKGLVVSAVEAFCASRKINWYVHFLPEETIIRMIVQILREAGDRWDEVRSQLPGRFPGACASSSTHPPSLSPLPPPARAYRAYRVLPGLPAPPMRALSLPLPGAALKHLVAIQLLLRELFSLLKVRGPTQFLSFPHSNF